MDKDKNKNNKNTAVIMTVALLLLIATSVLLSSSFLITPSMTNARSSGRGQDRCDPTVNVCVAGTTGSSKDLGKREQQRQPVAHTQTASSSPPDSDNGNTILKIPIATSGNNVYLAWPSNKTGNSEVMFRASSDGGKTFGDKVNLSNSSKSESVNAQIAAAGSSVYVTWWERNATSNEPLLRVSNDNGKTFAPPLMLTSGTTTSTAK